MGVLFLDGAQVNTQAAIQHEASLAKCVAGEDLQCGDMVAVLDEVGEYVSFLWDRDALMLPPEEPVRVLWRTRTKGRPLKIKAICLPFVFVKTPSGKHCSLDIRQCRLVRLDQDYAQRVWKKLRKRKKK
jgi:hypothetical protein